MSATALDVPAVKSSFPISVRTTDVLVTFSVSINKFRLGDVEEDMAGTACTDSDDDAVPAGYMVGLTDTIVPECNVDDDEDNDADKALADTEVVGFK